MHLGGNRALFCKSSEIAYLLCLVSSSGADFDGLVSSNNGGLHCLVDALLQRSLLVVEAATVLSQPQDTAGQQVTQIPTKSASLIDSPAALLLGHPGHTATVHQEGYFQRSRKGRASPVLQSQLSCCNGSTM